MGAKSLRKERLLGMTIKLSLYPIRRILSPESIFV
jgi:hypothetical protein